ncbi:Non-specific serine/threonine protein kinase [Bertholletia excelsa]
MAEKSVLHGKYELGRLLGHGTFAKVYLARNLQTGKSVAMKIVGKEKVIKVGMTEQVKREISVMKMVKHPNIVELHEVMASKTKIYFAMELVRGGELFSKIAKGRLREDAARHYFRQLISAVDFCHSRGVYHRDLKPENLLLDDNGNLKVTDFGLSALAEHLRQDGLLHTTCGTPAYVAPEVIGKKGYDGAKADIWSCGVILYVLLAGFLPFQDDNIVAMYRKIYRGDFKCPPWFSSDARRLITKLLDPNPNSRITVAKIMDSSWFKKPIPKSMRSKEEEEEEKEKLKFDFEFEEAEKKETEKRSLNAFHIISLSEGFDLSPLFEEKRREEKEEMRFATTRPASSVISRLEEVAARAGRFNVRRSGGGDNTSLMLQGQEKGRKGRLGIAADIFAVAPSFLVVEVKKSSGDTLEYNQFCSKELRPALKDIVWTSPVAEKSTPVELKEVGRVESVPA